MKKLMVVPSFLFAIYFILFLYAHNIAEVPANDLLLPTVVVLAGTSIVFFACRLITKSYVKSSIITSCFIILFFSYGHVRDLIPVWNIWGFDLSSGFVLGPLWGLLFIIVAFLVIRSRRNFVNFNMVLGVIGTALVVISLVNICIYQVRTADISHVGETEQTGLALNSSENLPDIYYIILDGYARASTLEDFVNYDNSEFIDYLTDKGFYIASKGRSNYASTILSLSSSLNMQYLDNKYLKDIHRMDKKAVAELFVMIQNNQVSQFLKSNGYEYIYVSNGYFENGMSQYADLHKLPEKIKMSHFTSYLIRTTVLAPFIFNYLDMNGSRDRAKVLYSFEVLATMPDIKAPTFVFAHVICPHPPYVFDRDGNPPALVNGIDPRDMREKYLDQIIFLNKKVEVLVGEILSKSDVPPIIILQGDHGWSLTNNEVTAETELANRMNILNAYFLPNHGDSLLYESITPVNSFRIVFNHYFNTDYELLIDESYISDLSPPYEFILIPPEIKNSD